MFPAPPVRSLVGLAAAVLLAALQLGCGDKGGSREATPVGEGSGLPDVSLDLGKPVLQPDGPVLGLSVTPGRKPEGPFGEGRPGFTTREQAVTAVVVLGPDAPSAGTLVLAWYRVVSRQERELIFASEIPVTGPGTGYSEALARGGLPAGSFETVAFLDGHQVRVPWLVAPAKSASLLPGTSPLLARLGQPSTLDLEPGDSGYVPAEPPPPLAPGECRAEEITGKRFYPMTVVEAGAEFRGDCPEATLTATVGGASAVLNSGPLVAQGYVMNYDLCFPGSSDLPGTVVQFTATSGGSTVSGSMTLQDAGIVGPGVDVVTEPAAGTRVRPGDRISIAALAFNVPPAYGIQTLYVSAGDALLEAAGNKAGSTEATPCDIRRLVAELETSYVVPRDPPAVVTIRAESVDFLGRSGPYIVRTVSFPTVDGEVWEGEISGELESSGCSTVVQAGSMTLIVDRDGKVRGQGTTTSGTYTCDNGASIPPQSIEYQITGTRTDRFTLTFQDGVQLTSSPIEGGRATIVQTTVGEVTVQLTCQNC